MSRPIAIINQLAAFLLSASIFRLISHKIITKTIRYKLSMAGLCQFLLAQTGEFSTLFDRKKVAK
jgi:hypothetical protein